MSETRKLSTILFADITGYTSLMQSDETHALHLLESFKSELESSVPSFEGQIVQYFGDAVLLSFDSTRQAVSCAMKLQSTFQQAQIPVRIGIHLGDVVFTEDNVFGDGVNIASRIESLGIPGSILVSRAIQNQVRNKPDIKLASMGSFHFKNVDEPMEVFALCNPGFVVPKREEMKGKLEIRAATAKIKWYSLVIAGLILLASTISLIVYNSGLSTNSSHGSSGSALHRLAVLPFSNLRDDPDSDYLGLALVDEIIGDLSYVKDILVRPSSAVRKYANTEVDAPTAGGELNVDYILVGNYMRVGSVIRMNLELVGVESNELVWGQKIEEEYQNTFQLQDIVSDKVLQGLKVQFSEEESQRRKDDISADPLAYEYYLRAVAQPSSHQGNNMAVNLLNKSVELDSLFAPAWSELGWRMRLLAAFTIREGHQVSNAEQILQKALKLNDDLQSALAILVAIYAETGRIDKSVETARHVLAINPNSAENLYYLGYAYRYSGFLEEAEREQEKALNLDPDNPRFNTGLTQIYLGKLKEALERFELNNESPYSLAWQGQIYLRLGDNERSLRLFNRVIEMDQEGIGHWVTSMKSHLEGRPEMGLQALQILEENLVDAEQYYNIANLYGLLGYKEQCIRTLRKAVSRGFFCYPVFLNDMFLDSVRGEPEFQEVLDEARIKHEAFERRYF